MAEPRYYILRVGGSKTPTGLFRTVRGPKGGQIPERFVKGEWVFDPTLAVYIHGSDSDADPATPEEAAIVARSLSGDVTSEG
jgi:hypothetical protein